VRTSGLAEALLTGLLQRLGTQHRSEAMIDAGKRLAERIVSNEAGAAEPRKRPGTACEVARNTAVETGPPRDLKQCFVEEKAHVWELVVMLGTVITLGAVIGLAAVIALTFVVAGQLWLRTIE